MFGQKLLTRRTLLKGAAGSMVLLAAACQPQVVEVVKEVPVEKVVTQVVEKEVQVEKVVTQVVEKEVEKVVEVEKIVEVAKEAEVRGTLCSLCGRCITVCPYGARSLSPDLGRILVDELLCQGCGACAAACPNSAAVLRGFKDTQVLSMIDAALETVARGDVTGG